MAKYIDADKLIAEMKIILQSLENRDCRSNQVKKIRTESMIELCKIILEVITSLQQEQPDVDLVAELKHHLSTTPKEQLEKEWKELEPWGNIGPTVQEFLYGKWPEVDLEKEIHKEE